MIRMKAGEVGSNGRQSWWNDLKCRIWGHVPLERSPSVRRPSSTICCRCDRLLWFKDMP